METSEKESSAECLSDTTVDTQALLAHQSLSEAGTEEGHTSLGESQQA